MRRGLWGIFILLGISFLSVKKAFSQDAVLYSQLFNQLELFNPAANAGSDGTRIGFFFRDQWLKINGAPQTIAIDAYFPSKNQHLGFGFSAFNQKIGLKEANFLLFNTNSYVKTSSNSTLSFGIRLGMEFLSYDEDKIISIDNSLINNRDLNSSSPVFNLGLVFKSEVFYAGMSSFQISFKDDLRNKKLLTGLDFISGYYSNIESNINFFTSIIVKTYFKEFSSIEPNAGILVSDKLSVGIGYRIKESIDFTVKVKLTNKLVVGYTYDHSLSELSLMSNGSNGFYLGYILGKKNILKPL